VHGRWAQGWTVLGKGVGASHVLDGLELADGGRQGLQVVGVQVPARVGWVVGWSVE
jgi:hypothetical protein